MACRKDDTREQRIAMDAIADAHDSEEQAMGWYYYLDDRVTFPFRARCRSARPISLLAPGEEVEVLDMAPEDECEKEMFVWVGKSGARVAVPLAQWQPLSNDPETQEAVADWLYWVDRGYEL